MKNKIEKLQAEFISEKLREERINTYLEWIDERFLFMYAGWKRTNIGKVLNLHKYKGKGRPRIKDYVKGYN